MSFRHVILVLFAVLVAGESSSQDVDPQQAEQELAAARAELQAGRDQIIREDLQLTETEAAAFWPIYREYVTDIMVFRDRKTELIGRFVQAVGSDGFDDEFAAWLIEENFAIKDGWSGTQKAYVPRFKAVLPVQKVARFYQLENKMDSEIDAQLAIAIPLAE